MSQNENLTAMSEVPSSVVVKDMNLDRFSLRIGMSLKGQFIQACSPNPNSATTTKHGSMTNLEYPGSSSG